MARGRMLSKQISLDSKVNALSSDTAALLFTWMIPHLDCEGRIYGDPATFKSLVVPRRKISLQKVEKVLTELTKLCLIMRYSVNGNSYIFAPGFEKHQMGLRKDRETPSQIPPPSPDSLQSNDGVTPAQGRGSNSRTSLSLSLSLSKDQDQEDPPLTPPSEGPASSSSSDSESESISEVDDKLAEVSRLYEQNIGMITPIIADELKEASAKYPVDWVRDALGEAVANNKRSWRYTSRILERWAVEGRDIEAKPLTDAQSEMATRRLSTKGIEDRILSFPDVRLSPANRKRKAEILEKRAKETETKNRSP